MRRPLLVLISIAALALGTAGCTRTTEDSEVPPPPAGGRYNVGRPAKADEIAALDIDVGPDGAELPPGRGNATLGAGLYKAQCASCHGAKGEGMPPYPKLVGREPKEGFPFGRDGKIDRTIGNYWPYATTLYDYIRRAMPMNAPGSLSNNEVYSVTAFLLAENEILPKDAPLDADLLRKVRMPARDRFVKDDRRGGPEVR